MDLATIRGNLEQARRHVERGERNIASQRRTVARLIGHGGVWGAAVDLLTVFEESQKLHVADSDHLERKLAEHLLRREGDLSVTLLALPAPFTLVHASLFLEQELHRIS